MSFKIFMMLCISKFDLNIIGLMCIPPNDKEAFNIFSTNEKLLKKNINVNELSMGMSNDYLNAIKYVLLY